MPHRLIDELVILSSTLTCLGPLVSECVVNFSVRTLVLTHCAPATGMQFLCILGIVQYVLR